MKNLITTCFLLVSVIGFNQNSAPIAITDTFFLSINEPINIDQYSGLSTGGNPTFLNNDNDPDGNLIFLDSTFYTGTGSFSDILHIQIPDSIHRNDINYSPPLNLWGVDSVIYILRDNGIPIMYDTSTIYFFIKQTEYETLDLNNIKARLSLSRLFSDDQNLSGFEVPKGSGSNTLYGANLWMSGKNQNTTYSNTETFGNEDPSLIIYQPFHGNSGPIMNPIHYKQYDYKWDRHWKITNDQINYHINNWNTGGYQPIEVIENWPAHGDVSKGQAANLAPFIDNNSDGIYNPMDGDYPQIKGQQAVYHIYNDMRYQPHTQNPMNTEVHYMAYAYNCPSDSAINNTIFLDYTIYNRSNLTYDSTYIGMWTDFDIGNPSDDYVGSDVNRSTYYGYNGDSNDENSGGVIGYGIHPPAQGVVFLKGVKQDDDGIDNNIGIAPYETVNGFGFGDGIDDNENWGMEYFSTYTNGGFNGDPTTGLEYYNYLSGKWKDGSTMVYGGTGHISSGGTIQSKYLFSGDTDPLEYGTGGITPSAPIWSEVSEANSPADRRGVGSTGPFTFEPDSSVSITLAYVFGRDYQTTGNQAGVIVMQERVDSIRSYYLDDFTSVCGGTVGISEKDKQEHLLSIYPNPFNNAFTINYELVNNTALLEVYNVLGEKTQTKTITQNSTIVDLSNQTNGFYFVTITDGTNRISKKIVKQ